MKDLNITKVIVCKCESCLEYHPVNECEYVLIKLIKGKNCPLPGNNLNMNVKKEETRIETVPAETPKVSVLPDAFRGLVDASVSQTEVSSVKKDDPAEILKDPNAILRVTPEGKKEYLKKQQGMPPDFRVFIQSEEKGAVITRKV